MIDELRKRISPDVKENVPLAPLTTFRIGGPAQYFFEATTPNDGAKALLTAKELGIPCTIIGGGSNMIVADAGVKGLVLKIVTKGLSFNHDIVTADAGLATGIVAVKAVGAGLAGFEWAVGIPGTIGGAARGNAGSFGGEMKDVIQSVQAVKDGEVRVMSNEECGFTYRNSIFKLNPDILVLQITLKLTLSSDIEASKAKIQEIMKSRQEKQPYQCPTAGCTFMNWKPPGDEELQSLRKDLDLNKEEEIPVTAQGTVPAGWILDRAQLKGYSQGKAKISETHANFIEAEEGATADNIVSLIASVKTKVRNMTHGTVNLLEEIEYVGF